MPKAIWATAGAVVGFAAVVAWLAFHERGRRGQESPDENLRLAEYAGDHPYFMPAGVGGRRRKASP